MIGSKELLESPLNLLRITFSLLCTIHCTAIPFLLNLNTLRSLKWFTNRSLACLFVVFSIAVASGLVWWYFLRKRHRLQVIWVAISRVSLIIESRTSCGVGDYWLTITSRHFVHHRTGYPFLILFVSLNMMASMLHGQGTFTFNEKTVLSGTMEHFNISVADAEHETTIPVTVFHGKEDGEVLSIICGVHGYEYAPILAGQQLLDRIDPTSLKGTIILVQIANVPSFLGRSPYTNPTDGKNLNRIFPGDPNGTLTERIADFISEKVIGRSDFFVDMHSGDAPEDLMAYSAYYQNDNFPDISRVGREMAAHMGFDHVIVFKTTGKDYLKAENPSLYCSAEAFKRGIPAVDVECGRLGMVEAEFVDEIVLGVESLLGHLGFTTHPPITTKQIAYIDERNSQSSAHTGFFYPHKASGNYVMQGMKIGYITNFFGQTLETIYAETSGIILYMLGTPPINKGETIVNIGKVK